MWLSSEGPREPFAYRGSSLEVPAPYRPPCFTKAQLRHSLIIPPVNTNVECAQDGLVAALETDCASLQAQPTRSKLAAKGVLILNPYHFVHLMCEVSIAEPIKDIEVIFVVRALRFHGGCVLSLKTVEFLDGSIPFGFFLNPTATSVKPLL